MWKQKKGSLHLTSSYDLSVYKSSSYLIFKYEYKLVKKLVNFPDFDVTFIQIDSKSSLTLFWEYMVFF